MLAIFCHQIDMDKAGEHDGQPDSGLTFVDRLEALIPEMRAFARSLCKDMTLADDLVQDTCLKAWSAMDNFDPERPMRPWLFRILRNEYYQVTRRSWRNVAAEPDLLENSLVENCSLDTQSEMARLSSAISDLPAAQCDALILVLAAGFTYEEAGEICGCSAGTVKSRVSRAREAVKIELEVGGKSPLADIIADKGLQAMGGLLERVDQLKATNLAA